MFHNDPYGLIAPAMLAELHKAFMNMKTKPRSSEQAEPQLAKAHSLWHRIVDSLTRRGVAPAEAKFSEGSQEAA